MPELMALSWPQVLAWRMRQQFLDPVGTASVEDVVRRLGAVQAQVDASVELAHPPSSPAVETGRGRPGPGRGSDHQVLGDARRRPSSDSRGRRCLPGPDGGQAPVGAAQLAELLRPDASRLGALPRGGAGGVGRWTDDAAGARGGDHRPPEIPASGLRVRRAVGHAPQATVLAGRHELRPVARRQPDLPAPGRQPAVGRPARSGRGRDSRGRVLPPRIRTGARSSTFGTGRTPARRRHGPGSRALATA